MLDTFDVAICYSYGTWENLSNLCDETVVHPVTNAIGTCFDDFSTELEAIGNNSDILDESETFVQTIGEAAFTIVELSVSSALATLDPECGTVAYMLADEADASLITVDPSGQIILESISDPSLVGTYTV